MKSAVFVSPDFLERVAEPKCPFILIIWPIEESARTELISRLPHDAMLGDNPMHGSRALIVPAAAKFCGFTNHRVV
jgi:hypothetical protein